MIPDEACSMVSNFLFVEPPHSCDSLVLRKHLSDGFKRSYCTSLESECKGEDLFCNIPTTIKSDERKKLKAKSVLET